MTCKYYKDEANMICVRFIDTICLKLKYDANVNDTALACGVRSVGASSLKATIHRRSRKSRHRHILL